jgi:Transposase DDE domain
MFSKEMLAKLEAKCPEVLVVRGLLENVLPAEVVDDVFQQHGVRQYKRSLLFSTVVEVLAAVVFNLRPSVTQAAKLFKDRLNSSTRALFGKLNRTEPDVSAALVRTAYQRMAPIVDALGSAHPPLFAGYQTRLLDGNHLASTDHRPLPLRRLGGGALPGVAVVVMDRERELFHSVSLSADAYTQERVLGLDLIGAACKGELWMADRNFCTSANVWQLHHVGAAFIFRRHKANVRFRTIGKSKRVGESSTGIVYQQRILIADDHGQEFEARLITIRLNEPTRDGDVVLELITNLPRRIGAVRIAEAYRQRWAIETSFAEVEKLFQSELPVLAQPGAALLVFCLSLIAWSALGILKAGLRREHGHERVTEELSIYYLVHKLLRNQHALEFFEDDFDLERHYAGLTARQMANQIRRLCRKVDLEELRKNHRGPKKKTSPPKARKGKPHFSSWRVLNNCA